MNRSRIRVKFLLSLLLIVGVFTVITVTASAEDGVSYVVRSWDDQTKTVQSETAFCTDYTDIGSAPRNLSGWYIVDSYVELSYRPVVNGEANIILCDGAKLYCKDGICVSEGNTLNIYCQKDESGELHCIAGTSDNAAIGANNEAGDCGTVIIHGGDVTADTGSKGTDGAGIGGGDEGNGGTVIIYGGNVKAIGGEYGAGIGGGDADGKGGGGGTTIIYGGTVDAKGGTDAAGIGGGEGGNGGVVEIWGGTVNAAGNDLGAGIGGGQDGNGGSIAMYGGVITARGSKDAAAIGRGDNGGKTDLIFGDMTLTSGPSESEAIKQIYYDRVERCGFAYAKVEPCTQHEFITGRPMRYDSETHSYICMYCYFTDEKHTHPHNLQAGSWKWSDDYKNATVSVNCPTCRYAEDISIPAGQISDVITDEQADEHTFTATFTYNGKEYTNTAVKCRASYTDLDGGKHEAFFDRLTSDTKNLNGGWYVVKGDVSASDRIICSGDVNLVLDDGAALKAPKGISVNEGANLTVWGDSEGTGKLVVDSADNDFAGIGGDKEKASGQITINGGTITAKGGIRAAGIGGGANGKGNVTINGGTVDAEGGTYTYGLSSAYVIEDKAVQSGAGIGGGTLGEGVVTINGGSIKAKGGKAAAGIGGGKQGTGNVTINGGAVNAAGGTETLYIAYPERHQAHILGGAGIGGGEKSAASLITVNGGDIFARGGGEAAGIGSGGFDINSSNNDLWSKGKVIINGGTVDAIGGTEAAGIGGGGGSRCEGLVTITGGTVIAAGGGNAAAIGGGMYNRGVVDITGGHITADSGGIGSGWDDGYHKAPKGSVTLGYGDEGAAIYSSEYHNTDITLTKQFTDGTDTYQAKAYGAENEDTFKGKTIWSLGTAFVEWKNYDGAVLKRDLYKPDMMPVYTGEKPKKAADDYYTYSFTGWAPEITKVAENKAYSYTAQFVTKPRVLISDIIHGKVTSDAESAKPGDTVTLDLEPKAGCNLENIQAYTITLERSPVSLTALNGQGGTGGEGYPKLVDGDINTKWYTPFNGSDFIILKADKSVSMKAYVLTTANDTGAYSGRNWKDWTIYGANFDSDSKAVCDSGEWQEITSVKNDNKLPAKNFTQTDYILDEPADEYQYYMIEVTAKGPSDRYGNNIQMAEFTMYDKFLGERVQLKGSGDTRTFTMPDKPVTVSAVFDRPIFAGYNMSLGGDIGLIYYLDMTDKEAENNTVDFNWSYNVSGKLKNKSYSSELMKDDEDGVYMAVCPVPAAEMIYGIDASITVGGETYTNENYSVVKFADIILTGEEFAKSYIELQNARGNNGEERLRQLRTLIKAMLDYGSWAQVHFDRNPDTLVNSEFVTDDPTSPYYYVPEKVDASMINTGSSDMNAVPEKYGLEYKGSTVVYLSMTSMRHYYKITNKKKFDAIKDKITFDGKKAGYTVKDDLIYFELQDITAPDLDTLYTLKIGKNEYKYSVLDYVKTCLASNQSAESLKNLSAATYRYNKAADVFFGPAYSGKTQSNHGERSGGKSAKAMNRLKSSVKSVLKGLTGEAITGDEYETPLMNDSKAENTLAVKGKTAKVSYKKLQKKSVTIARAKVLKVTGAKGTVTYKLVSAKKGKDKYKKYFKINKKTGKVTVKKGLKKGTYKIRVKVTAKGNANYKSKTLTRTGKIKIK